MCIVSVTQLCFLRSCKTNVHARNDEMSWGGALKPMIELEFTGRRKTRVVVVRLGRSAKCCLVFVLKTQPFWLMVGCFLPMASPSRVKCFGVVVCISVICIKWTACFMGIILERKITQRPRKRTLDIF